jgi:hypothetical protein
MSENIDSATNGSTVQENRPFDEQLAYAWVVNLLSVLDDNLPDETKKAVLNGCAAVHYRALNMDELIGQYRGDLAGFIALISEKWQWKVDYDAEARVIIADENKPECVCPVARLGQVSGVLCYCSEGFAERMFSGVVGGPVQARVVRSILRGDKSCVYQIQIL